MSNKANFPNVYSTDDSKVNKNISVNQPSNELITPVDSSPNPVKLSYTDSVVPTSNLNQENQ